MCKNYFLTVQFINSSVAYLFSFTQILFNSWFLILKYYSYLNITKILFDIFSQKYINKIDIIIFSFNCYHRINICSSKFPNNFYFFLPETALNASILRYTTTDSPLHVF